MKAILQGLVAGAVLHHSQRLGGRRAIGPEEGDTVTVTCGVNADADAIQGCSGGHGRSPQEDTWSEPGDMCRRGGRESPPENLGPSDPCDKRSGPHDVPIPYAQAGGKNLGQEVNASGW